MMRLPVGLCAVCTSTMIFAMQLCHAQSAAPDYPRKTVRVIVPIPPGGGTDTIARLVAPKLGGMWNQTVVIENQGGGGTTIGTQNAVKSAPDGYTLLLTSLSVAYAPALYRNLAYDTERDLAPIALIATQPSMLVVHPSLPVKSLSQLVALAKSKPGEIFYSSGGSGSPSHLAVELLRAHAKMNIVHVPYKGGGPAGIAAVTGEAQMTITNVSSLLPHVRSGRLRALAVTGASRAKAAPELPTVAEAALPGYEFEVWYGLLAPSKTPAALVARINEDLNRALGARDLQDRFAALGIEGRGGTQQSFASYLSSEIAKWNKVVGEAGIKAE
jgi:tripartite-type tricarboxylate transporter receptor subunit TctC